MKMEGINIFGSYTKTYSVLNDVSECYIVNFDLSDKDRPTAVVARRLNIANTNIEVTHTLYGLGAELLYTILSNKKLEENKND